jgi:ADP-dependent glucokinase
MGCGWTVVAIAAVVAVWVVRNPLRHREWALREALKAHLLSHHHHHHDHDGQAARSAAGRTFVIGTNAAVDLIAPALPALDALNLTARPTPARDHPVLQNHGQLAEAFAYYFQHGAAAERSFMEGEAYAALVATLSSLPSVAYNTGGNAALMAEFLVNPGDGGLPEQQQQQTSNVTLVAHVGPLLRGLLNPRLQIPASCHQERDEVHVILEYHAGEQWQAFTGGRSNRFIFSHDMTNAKLLALPQLEELLSSDLAHVHVVVLSGLNMLEGQPAEYVSVQLERLSRALDGVAAHVLIHLELARCVALCVRVGASRERGEGVQTWARGMEGRGDSALSHPHPLAV